MKKKFMLFALLVLGGISAFAEESPVLELKQTVVTSDSFGTPVRETAKNITVIGAKEIKEKGAKTVADALRGVSGVVVRQMDGASPMIDLRGSGATAQFNTVILLDGIPVSGLAGFDLNTVPVEEIEKIEVLQGAGAVMYGDGAIGGVVNIITKAPTNKAVYGGAGLEVGSWRTIRENVYLGGKIGNKFLLNASYSGYTSEDYRDRDPKYYGRKDFRNSTWLRGKYLLDNGSIALNYNHSEDKDYYTGYLEKKQFDDNPRQKGAWGGYTYGINDIINAKYNQKINDKIDIFLTGGYYHNKSKYQNNVTKEYFIRPEVKFTYAKDSYVTLGFDYRDGRREFKDDVLINGISQKAPNDKRKSFAGYVMNKSTFGNWQFTQGYRREKVEYKYSSKVYDPMTWQLKEIKPKSADYSNNDSFEFGVNYLYSDTGNVFFNYTRALRTPTIQDAGAWYGPVKTQKNDIFEIGLRDAYKNTSIATSVFYINSKNEIYYDKTNPFSSNNQNFDGKVRRIGAQLSLAHYFDKLTLRERVSYIVPKVKSGVYNGKEFAGVSRWTVNVGATYNIIKGLTANADIYYQSKYYAEDDFDNYFSKGNNYVTVDANLSYAFENGIELYTGVSNLFDKKYANAVTSTRSAWAPGPRKVYYPANGRSVYAGIKYTF